MKGDLSGACQLSDAEPADRESLVFRSPRVVDGARIHELVRSSPPLDINSPYCYLLLCSHFSKTCLVAVLDGRIIAFLSGYIPPEKDDVFFVWQIAVDASERGRGIGKRLLLEALRRSARSGCRYLETTITPSNRASRALFRSLAKATWAVIHESPCFSEEDLGQAGHEAEMLFTIGPIKEK